jgi:hypothetical protein
MKVKTKGGWNIPQLRAVPDFINRSPIVILTRSRMQSPRVLVVAYFGSHSTGLENDLGNPFSVTYTRRMIWWFRILRARIRSDHGGVC